VYLCWVLPCMPLRCFHQIECFQSSLPCSTCGPRIWSYRKRDTTSGCLRRNNCVTGDYSNSLDVVRTTLSHKTSVDRRQVFCQVDIMRRLCTRSLGIRQFISKMSNCRSLSSAFVAGHAMALQE
jgi:hypothetical protein